MKTVVISSFHPHISRNILLSPFMDYMKKADARIVIVTAEHKVEYYRKAFAGERVLVEGVPLYQASRTKRGVLFKRLGYYLFNTETARTRKRYEYYCRGKYLHYAVSRCFGFIGRFALVRRFVRRLDRALSPRGIFAHILDAYRPDLIFATDIQNENDVSLMQDAHRCCIQIAGMIRSWDNTTQRIIRVFPDRLIVGSRMLADEVLELYRFPREKIAITGDPRYDRYRGGPSRARDEFCGSFGLDPKKKLVLYAPISDMLIRVNDVDQPIVELLGTLDAGVIVRFPPSVAVRLDQNFRPPANTAFDRPGVGFEGNRISDQEISREDDQRLIDALYHADVVLSGPTSIPIDAALMDTPAIMVEIYKRPYDFCESIFNYGFAHIRKVLAVGGIRHAKSSDELKSFIDDYLKNPELDRAERAKIRERWHSHADGRAGERLASEIIAMLGCPVF